MVFHMVKLMDIMCAKCGYFTLFCTVFNTQKFSIARPQKTPQRKADFALCLQQAQNGGEVKPRKVFRRLSTDSTATTAATASTEYYK